MDSELKLNHANELLHKENADYLELNFMYQLKKWLR